MRSGMLWFDNDTRRNVDEKVRRAVDYYQGKYGTVPTLCFVHPSMLDESVSNSSDIEVRTANTVLPHHFWLGRDSSHAKN